MDVLGFVSMPKSVPPGSMDGSPKKRALRELPTVELPPDDLQAIFGHNVRIARLKRAMTQDEVAEAVGMTGQYVGQIEKGEKNVTLDTMKKLAVALDFDLNGMFRPPTPGEQQSLRPAKKKDD